MRWHRVHLDSFYGGIQNAVRIEAAGGGLRIDYRIPFRQTVVRYGLDVFVPLALGHKKQGEVLRMLQLLCDGSARVTTAYDYQWLCSDEARGWDHTLLAHPSGCKASRRC